MSANNLSGNSSINIHELPNGITLIGEEMPNVSSAAFSILAPLGAATDPDGSLGSATILAEMFNKGAGSWNAKQLSEEFESLGIHRDHSSGIEVSIFSGLQLGENLCKALKLYGTVLLKPSFPEEELDSIKQLALQEIRSLRDRPSSQVMVELAEKYYPAPFGRPQMGTEEGVESVTIESLRKYYDERFAAERTIIAVAGAFDWEEVKQTVEEAFGGWSGSTELLEVGKFSDTDQVHAIVRDTTQVQIALAYPSVTIEHPDYYTSRVGVGVLSGGMSGRLFIEVREKRGLVYRVSASHSAARGRAAVFAYAGTMPERAQETLDVMLEELKKLEHGVSDEELERSKADLKSRIIISGESTSARASSLVNDWWNLSRIRTLEEIKDGIEAVTSDDISKHLSEFPVSPVTLVTLGPAELELKK